MTTPTHIDIPHDVLPERDVRHPPGPPRGVLLLTGATGYIGGRLAPRLLESGWALRCLVRSPDKLRARAWASSERVEIIESDLSDEAVLTQAMRGCDAAYYLVHSMLAVGQQYANADREMAERFARAAAQAGTPRIIYLGGLGELGAGLSEHLRSRRDVEEALASTGVPLTALRAAMIIGSGSASFEILRYLVERLPIMITPRWVSTRSQPIAVRNVLHYLQACLTTPDTTGRVLDIGGPDVLTYLDLMHVMAAELRLRKRIVLPVPLLTPRLSSLWIHLVTPLSARLARPLAEGLRNEVVCRDDEAARLMPQQLLGVREAIGAALGKIASADVETFWSDAGPIPGDPDWAGGTVFLDERTIEIDASPDRVFKAVCRVGGGHGWYAADWLWRVRGFMDRIIGGPGLRRGRRHPEDVVYGDALDFWRVIGLERNRRLTLRAEMKLPGDAVLEFRIAPPERDGGPSMLTQAARFKPRGLLGLLYWYAVLPLHGVVFSGMQRGIKRAAEKPIEAAQGAPSV
ncbi:MAG: SDR family oxidoreductase [Phycisphaerales bacterium]|nr:MAG: SDR family oxidoreductase [Phycisphaerales bacterium]